MNKINEIIGKNFICVMVDEITDARGLYIANLHIGVVNKDYAGKPYHLASKKLNKTNNETISKFINYSLKLLCPPHNDEKKGRELLKTLCMRE